MKKFRCSNCNKLLANINPGTTTIPNDILDVIENVREIDKDNCTLEIKCPRCQQLNNINV